MIVMKCIFFFGCRADFFPLLSLTTFVGEPTIQNNINEMSRWLCDGGGGALRHALQTKNTIQTKTTKKKKTLETQKKTRWAFVSTFWQVLPIIFHSFYRWDPIAMSRINVRRTHWASFGLFQTICLTRARKFSLVFIGWLGQRKGRIQFWCGSSSPKTHSISEEHHRYCIIV